MMLFVLLSKSPLVVLIWPIVTRIFGPYADRARSLRSAQSTTVLFGTELALYSLSHPAEGSHNGSAAVLKTAGRKAMQVRVLSPPPFLFKELTLTSLVVT